MTPATPIDSIWAVRTAAPTMRARFCARLETSAFSRSDSSSACSWLAPDVAVEDGQRQEHAARMIDAGKAGVGDQVEALLAAVVGVRAPADVGDEAGGIAQAPFLGRLLGAGRLEQRIRPLAQLPGVLDGARAQARVLGAEATAADPCAARAPATGE